MPDLQTLREQRSNIVTEMRGLDDKASTEKRDLSDSENGQFTQLKTDLKRTDSNIERAEILADAERNMDSVRINGVDSFEQQARSFQITKAIAGKIEAGSVDDGREREISAEMERRSGRKAAGVFVPHQAFEKRALLTSNSSELVPTQHRSELMIDTLRDRLVTQQLGATVLGGLTGDQSIPKLATSASHYWVAEHGDITASDQGFDSVTMGAKTVGAEVEYSRRMMLNASPDIENLVRSDIAQVIAQAIDYAALTADGTGNQPTGIINQSGINTVSFGGAPTWAKLLEFEEALSTDSALMGSLGWVAEPQAVRTLKSTEKVSGHPEYLMANNSELAGYPLAKSLALPVATNDSTIIFGNWADLLIGYWSGIDILVNPYHKDVYSKGGVRINALQDCDVAVRHPESFVVATDLSTA